MTVLLSSIVTSFNIFFRFYDRMNFRLHSKANFGHGDDDITIEPQIDKCFS
ncbi:Uncharacterised protein [Serratia fonticola]|uniref:Uncharacterized protein n=1 Tax=Serratia fonticola TaxID=47917 RepID=A0A4U9U1T7_SERFO|nr:Uncharacterised protein [Serratia fonticola]